MKKLQIIYVFLTIILAGCNAGSNNAPIDSSTVGALKTQYGNESVNYHRAAILAPNQTLAGYKINSIYQKNGVIYAGTNFGLFISDNLGHSWSIKNTSNGLPSNQIQQITADEYGVYAIMGGNAMVSVDRGETWSVLLKHDQPDFNSIFISNNTIYLGYDGGVKLDACKNHEEHSKVGIALSKDHGKNWSVSTNMSLVAYTADSLVVNNARIYFIDHCWNRLVLSTDSGKNWSFMDESGIYVLPNANGKLKKVISNGNYIYVASSTGISVSGNNGVSFNFITKANGLPSNNVNDLFLSESATQLMAATDSGYAISYNNGNSFMSINSSELNQVPADNVTTIYSDNSLLLMGTNNGMVTFNRSLDLSINANPYPIIPMRNLTFLSSLFPTQDSLFVGSTGDGVKIWHQSTQQWQQVIKTGDSNGIADNLIYQIIVNKGKTYIATDNGISISTDNINWNNISQYDGLGARTVTSIAAIGDNIYAATGFSGISYSFDDGKTWSTHSFPNIYYDIIGGNSNMMVNSVFVDGQNIYASTDDGVYISRDNGLSWAVYLNKRTDNDKYASRIIYRVFSGGNYVYVASSDGLWVSNDGGFSWKQTLAGEVVYSVVVRGGVIYVSFSNGGVAISKDNAKTFKISNNLGYSSSSLVHYLQVEQWWGSFIATSDYTPFLGVAYNYTAYYNLPS